jgi:hypothetical protein
MVGILSIFSWIRIVMALFFRLSGLVFQTNKLICEYFVEEDPGTVYRGGYAMCIVYRAMQTSISQCFFFDLQFPLIREIVFTWQTSFSNVFEVFSELC